MADKVQRLPDESSCPPELECLAGHAGPYIKADKAEFHHGSKSAQEWFLRLDDEDVEKIRWTVRAGSILRSIVTWTVRGFFAFLAAFGGVFVFGERLSKLPETISGALSGLYGTLQLLRGLLGL